MSKISLAIPDEGMPFVSQDQIMAVVNGYHQTMMLLGDLASTIKLFRVSFERLKDTNQYGPQIQVFFQDPLGNECSHSTGYQHIGSHSPRPTADEIAEHLCGSGFLQGRICARLLAGLEELKRVNAEFKRLGKDEGFRLEFNNGSMKYAGERLAHYFRADSREAALRYVADHLKIPYPMSVKDFYLHDCAAVFQSFTKQIFPPKA